MQACPATGAKPLDSAHLAWIVLQRLLQIAFADVSNEKQTEAHSKQNQALLQKILDTPQAAIF